jgi:hypothetical protein
MPLQRPPICQIIIPPIQSKGHFHLHPKTLNPTPVADAKSNPASSIVLLQESHISSLLNDTVLSNYALQIKHPPTEMIDLLPRWHGLHAQPCEGRHQPDHPSRITKLPDPSSTQCQAATPAIAQYSTLSAFTASLFHSISKVSHAFFSLIESRDLYHHYICASCVWLLKGLSFPKALHLVFPIHYPLGSTTKSLHLLYTQSISYLADVNYYQVY